MQPGEIYKMNFAFQPPEQGSEYRPALIMYVDHVNSFALAVKITTISKYPFREKIQHRDFASLDRTSYAQYDWYNTISLNVKCKYLGTLHASDFSRIISRFKDYHGI